MSTFKFNDPRYTAATVSLTTLDAAIAQGDLDTLEDTLSFAHGLKVARVEVKRYFDTLESDPSVALWRTAKTWSKTIAYANMVLATFGPDPLNAVAAIETINATRQANGQNAIVSVQTLSRMTVKGVMPPIARKGSTTAVVAPVLAIVKPTDAVTAPVLTPAAVKALPTPDAFTLWIAACTDAAILANARDAITERIAAIMAKGGKARKAS